MIDYNSFPKKGDRIELPDRDIKEILDYFKFSNTTGIIRAITGETNKYKEFYWTL